MRTSLETRAAALLSVLLQESDPTLLAVLGTQERIDEARALRQEIESGIEIPDAAIDPLAVISHAEDTLIRIGREVLAASLTSARLTLLKQKHADALTWEDIDSRRARAEGWDIVFCNKNRRWMLEVLEQGVERSAKLHNAELALGHLWDETVAGSDFHRRALRLLSERAVA